MAYNYSCSTFLMHWSHNSKLRAASIMDDGAVIQGDLKKLEKLPWGLHEVQKGKYKGLHLGQNVSLQWCRLGVRKDLVVDKLNKSQQCGPAAKMTSCILGCRDPSTESLQERDTFLPCGICETTSGVLVWKSKVLGSQSEERHWHTGLSAVKGSWHFYRGWLTWRCPKTTEKQLLGLCRLTFEDS